MRESLPPLSWLRAFEATARHLSFTHAAQELALTQAAVSKQVKLLELHLGAKLFVRHARSLEITRLGQAYLPTVTQSFDALSIGTHQLFASKKSSVLTVRTSIGFGALWLAPRVWQFRTTHPDVHLRIISNVWREDDAEGHCDLDIRYGTGEWANRKSLQLTNEELFPVCHPAFLESGRLTSPADLEFQTLIEVMGYADGWSEWLSHARITFPNQPSRIAVDTTNMALAMLMPDFGITIGRSSLVSDALAAGTLVAPFGSCVPAKENLFLTVAPGHDTHPDADVFVRWLTGLKDHLA